MLSVLHTIATLDSETGGPASSVAQLSMSLSAAGVQSVVWIAVPPSKKRSADLASAGVEVRTGSLENALNSLKEPRLIHDHGIWLWSNHRVARLAIAHRIPRVVSPHGMLEPWSLSHRRWKKRLAWALYQHRDLAHASALHATAPAEAEQFRKLGLRPPVFIAPNGVALPAEMPARDADHGGPRTALFLSRIHPKKGLPTLVEAWQRVRPAGWRMVVVGPDEGNHRAAVQEQVRQAGLTDEWDFRDHIDGAAKWQLLVNADLFVLPTYSENFGIAVAEALAAGTPVITTTGAPWEGLVRNQCGWWVEPRLEAITDALSAACSMSSADLAAMGQRGRQWATTDFNWSSIAQQMIGAYEWVLNGGPAPASFTA